MKLTLPTDSAARKRFPLRTGVFNYFPAALAGVAQVSIDGNDKHNPGQPLHHARGKSADHADCIDRHLTDVQDILAHIRRAEPNTPAKGDIACLLNEVNQLAWRALALAQEVHETYGGSPLAPAAKLPEPVAPLPIMPDDKAEDILQRLQQKEKPIPFLCERLQPWVPYQASGPAEDHRKSYDEQD